MKWTIRILCLLVVAVGATGRVDAAPRMPRYAVAAIATPVLNTPDFRGVFGGNDGMKLRMDSCGQIEALEFVAFPRTVFTITDVIRNQGQTIYRVTSDEYPYPEPRGYYVDSRFVRVSDLKPPPRPRDLLPVETIVERLLAAQGVPYVWGGNLTSGIPQMLLFYPPRTPLRDRDQLSRWLMAGVDCSGLLYEATEGYTPRNTSGLVTFGHPIPVSGLKVDEIIAKVKPLDLIVWRGHVIIILDKERVIQSKLDCQGWKGGVRVAPLREVLEEILQKRMPADEHCIIADKGKKSFMIRRWYGIVASREIRLPCE